MRPLTTKAILHMTETTYLPYEKSRGDVPTGRKVKQRMTARTI